VNLTLNLIDNKTAPPKERFRWQIKARNGKIVAASSEGFSSRAKCEKNLWIVRFALDGKLSDYKTQWIDWSNV